MTTPTQAEQSAEATARAQAGIDPAQNVQAIEGSEADGGAPEGGEPARVARPQPADPAPPPLPTVKAPFDGKRADIIARFRQGRDEDAQADAVDRDQMRDFARVGLPPELGGEGDVDGPELEPAAPLEPEAPVAPEPQAPQTVRLKVHGKDIDMSIEDVIAKAQIALASDNILDAAKSRLKEVDDLFAQTRDRVQRADPATQHQGAPNSTQPPNGQQPPIDPAAVPEHHEDSIAKLIETLQFGDPGEARNLLENTISEAVNGKVTKAVTETLQAQRLKDEGARSDKVLKDFLDQHADLAADPMAQAAIERNIYDLQVEDLKALGVDPTKIPTPNGVVTPADIAMAHRWYRAEGFRVKSPKDMLETATSNFLTWKGVAKKTDAPADPAPKAAPRVDVTVDRSARRQAIPQQPTRTVAPKPDASAAPQPRDRSDTVRAMAQRRSLPRGRTASV